jgi:hypothetical protein
MIDTKELRRKSKRMREENKDDSIQEKTKAIKKLVKQN